MIRRIPLMAAMLSLIAAAPPPISAPGYQPVDKDERGLWMQVDEQERSLKTSNFVIRDPALNDYVRKVFCKIVPDDCNTVRIYVMRTPYFNASMAPNGMMQVLTGLFLRTHDEAQLAAVLAHEYTHYQNKHTLQLFRDLRSKAGVATFLGGFGLAGALIGVSIIAGAYQFSRDMEREADANSVALLVKAGYDPRAASKIWEQIRAEMDATAEARNVASRKDRTGGMFGTHPPTGERMASLAALADKLAPESKGGTNADAYRAAISPYWAMLVDDQIKLNDFGGSDFLLTSLAVGGWTPQLLYARGELYRKRGAPEDLRRAAEFYHQALDAKTVVPEAWRGLGLALLRSGDKAEGQLALKNYLINKPDASDRQMIAMLAE